MVSKLTSSDEPLGSPRASGRKVAQDWAEIIFVIK